MFASPELINHMNKVKDSYNVNSMTQIAGEAALLDRTYWDWLVRSTITEREWLLAECAQFGWLYPKTDVRATPTADDTPMRMTVRMAWADLTPRCSSFAGQFCAL